MRGLPASRHARARFEPPCPAECQEWRFRRLRRGAGRTVHCHRGIAGDGHVRCDDADRFRRFRCSCDHPDRPFRARRPPDRRFRAAGQPVRSDARVERAAGQSHANVCSRPPPVRADGRNPRSGGAGRFPAALPRHVHARRHVRLRQFERGSNFPEAMRMPPSRPPSQSSTTSRSTYHNTASSASKARPAAANRPC